MATLLAGRYRLEELLGRGGMGWVQRATDTATNREVAIKFLKADDQPERLATAFSWEVGAVARLDHAGIVPLYDFGRTDQDEPYIVMGLSPGTPLNQIDRGAFTWPTFCAILEQILQILAHSHARGVFHHDLKPGNVLVYAADDGEVHVQLIDFGIAGVLDPRSAVGSGPTELLGTASYLAPEKVKHFTLYRFSPSADIYAIGVISFEMAYGARPFVADDAREILRMHQVREPPVMPFTEVFEAAPTRAHGFIRKMLAKNPRDRFGTTSEALLALRQLSPRDAIGGRLRVTNLPGPRYTISPRDLARESPQDHAKLLGVRPPPFAGRRQEQHYLSARLTDSVMRQKPQVVLLTGPDGVGKSRLVRQVSHWAAEQGRAVAANAPYSLSGSDSVEGWRNVLLSLLGYAGAQRELLDVQIDDDLRWLGLRGELEPDVVLELLFPSTGDAGDGRAALNFDWVGTYLRLVIALARKRPLLIVLEDVRSVDDARGVELLEFLLRSPDSASITVVLTMASPDIGEPGDDEASLRRLDSYPGFHKTRLSSLSSDEMAQLLGRLMPLERTLADKVVGAARGLPIFLVELIRYFVRSRLLKRGESGHEARVAELSIPSRVGDIWRARLELAARSGQQGDRFVELLRRAAVLGQPFTYHELAALADCEGRGDLSESLSAAWSTWHAEGLWEQIAPGRALFAHGSLRSAVLEGLEPEDESTIHRFCAQARLRSPTAAGGAADVLAVARHYAAADLPNEAFPFYLRAAREASRTGRYPAAVAYCRQAAQLLVESGAQSIDRRWASVYRLLAEALLELGRYDDVEEIAGRLASRAQQWDDSLHHANALVLVASSRIRRGQAATAEDFLLGARTLYENLGVHSELGRCELHLGEIWQDKRSPEEVRERFRLARRHFAAVKDSHGTAQALMAESTLLRDMGELPAASHFLGDAYNIFKRLDRRAGMADVLRLRGRVALLEEQHALALDAFAEASQVYRAIGDRAGLALCVLETGRAYRALRQLSQAETCFRRAREEFIALGERRRSVQAHLGLVQLAIDSGHWTASRPHLEHLLTECRQTNDPRSELMVYVLNARCSAELGEWSIAENDVARATALLERLVTCDPNLMTQLERVAELADAGEHKALSRVAAEAAQAIRGRLKKVKA